MTTTLLAIGDFGEATPLRRRMSGAIRAWKGEKDAVLALGDNFYDYGVASTSDPLWLEWEQAFQPSCPWFAVLGNHDYLGNTDAQLEYRHRFWRAPARYYDHRFFFPGNDRDGVHVFFLDTFTLSPRHSQEYTMAMNRWWPEKLDPTPQLRWLDNALEKSDLTWRVVVGHYPVFSNGHHGNNDEMITNLLPILHRHRVDIYACGHDHSIAHFKREETQFFLSGTGCRLYPSRESPGYARLPRKEGVLVLRLGERSGEAGFIGEDGEWFYRRALLPNQKTHRLSFQN